MVVTSSAEQITVVVYAVELELRYLDPMGKRLGAKLVGDGLSGELRVSEVSASGIAHRAGLEDGDLLVRVSGESINENSAAAAKPYLKSRAPGGELTIVVKRGNDTLTLVLRY